MNVYKYLKKKDARSMFEYGSVRIGTLYEYRQVEIHGSEVGDAKEGTILRKQSGPIVIDSDNSLQYGFILKGPGKMFVQKAAQVEQNSENVFVYSVSAEYNEFAMRKMGYDACVLINDFDAFLVEISRWFVMEGRYQGQGRCLYRIREMDFFAKITTDPIFIKPYEFVYQDEIRAVWRGTGGEISPRIKVIPSVRKFCTIL